MHEGLPLPLRLLNLAGRGASAMGIHPVGLKMEQLLHTAQQNTGLEDFGEDDFRQPLALLLDCLEREADLSMLGRMIARADLSRIAAYYAQALAEGYNNTVAYRQSGKLPEEQVVDLYFNDFLRDQVGTVRRAYQNFDMELPEQVAGAMQSFLEDNPADKFGKHLYQLADTGMDEDYLRGLFINYESYFDIPREVV